MNTVEFDELGGMLENAEFELKMARFSWNDAIKASNTAVIQWEMINVGDVGYTEARENFFLAQENQRRAEEDYVLAKDHWGKIRDHINLDRLVVEQIKSREIDFITVQKAPVQEQPTHQSPPKGAIFLLYLFHKRDVREAMMGDFEEDFNEAFSLFGYRTAAILYWKNVLASFVPSLTGWLVKGAFFSKLIEVIARKVAGG